MKHMLKRISLTFRAGMVGLFDGQNVKHSFERAKKL